jgi:hypothetical protein
VLLGLSPWALACAALLGALPARADEPAKGAEETIGAGSLAEAEPEIVPPPPRRRGLVLESSLGALGFFSRFRHVAPLAPLMRLAVGYEPFRWLLGFVEGELGFADTSIEDDPSRRRAFALGGFAAGARGVVPIGGRVDLYVQASVGAMKADVANRALANIGYPDAESLGLSLAARVGVDWFQIDRHLALGFSVGARDAKGFAKEHSGETALAADAALTLRYAF